MTEEEANLKITKLSILLGMSYSLVKYFSYEFNSHQNEVMKKIEDYINQEFYSKENKT